MSACALNPIIHSALLAGGRSTRMGTDKRYLRLNGEFVIDRMVRLAMEWASRNSGNPYICGNVDGYPSIPDLVPNMGPIGGLHSVLNLLLEQEPPQMEWLLLFPVDMPMLSLSLFDRLAAPLKECEPEADSFDGIRFAESELPCLFRITDHLGSRLIRLLENPLPSSRSLRGLQQTLQVCEVPVDEDTMANLENVNTPEDWLRVRKVL